jgi:hypothetical protein
MFMCQCRQALPSPNINKKPYTAHHIQRPVEVTNYFELALLLKYLIWNFKNNMYTIPPFPVSHPPPPTPFVASKPIVDKILLLVIYRIQLM